MTSYASIDRIEGKYAVCEVELEDVANSSKIDLCEMETEMLDIDLEKFTGIVGTIEEGDVLIVEHDGQEILWVYCKDEEEKQRREIAIRELMEQL